MKLSDLLPLLQRHLDKSPDIEVVMSRDPEGNGFHPLGDVEVSPYSVDYGEVLHPDDVDDKDIIQVVVLWPK
jgi:hypothetical protein